MNQKQKVSKIPSIFTKVVSAKSTSKFNETIKKIKTPPKNLRRSRTVLDMPSTKTFTKPVVPSTLTKTVQRPIKRPAAIDIKPSTSILHGKKTKIEENSENIAPKKRPKPAPYDFKTKFNYVKEDYDKLKEAHRELKEKYISCTDNSEDMITKNIKLESELNELNVKHTQLLDKAKKMDAENDTLTNLNKNLTEENDSLKTSLKEMTENFQIADKDLKQLRVEFKSTNSELQTTKENLEHTTKSNEHMRSQLITMEKKIREMHNTIQELKGNIRVFCRIRPPLINEQDKVLYNINYVDEKTIELLNTKDKKSDFSFDKVFGPNSSQLDIFTELSQLVQSALDGYNVCIFAYGQTGSGKTYTMDGERQPQVNLGMIPRSIDLIFTVIQDLAALGWKYIVKASFLEIYNENIIDLLDPKKCQLDIRMVEQKSNDIYVTNLTVKEVNGPNELKNLLTIAQRNRAVAATENNERSSRSHSVAKITLEGYNHERNEKYTGSLNLVDLAGSEKFYTNETQRFNETKNINKSLSNLSNVILSLVRKNSHIPYRNSKLTHLLMPCLGGNSKTLMLVNISPLEDCYAESVNSLRFASNVNQCKTGSIKKQKTAF